MVTWLCLTYGKDSFVKAQTYDGKEVFFLFDLPSRKQLKEYLDMRDEVWNTITSVQDDFNRQQRNK